MSLPLIWSFVPRAVNDIKNAVQSVASYMLFDPGDEVMQQNLVYYRFYRERWHLEEEDFNPRPVSMGARAGLVRNKLLGARAGLVRKKLLGARAGLVRKMLGARAGQVRTKLLGARAGLVRKELLAAMWVPAYHPETQETVHNNTFY